MTSAFFGLGIGSSALRTAQAQVDITNQNVANANTPGYSRQSATITAGTPFPAPTYSSSGIPGQMGTGVKISSITRARNTFVDYQMRGQLTLQGQADAHTAALTQVEATINEPSTTGLASTVTKYWAAWHEVANTPADSAVRTNLVQAGVAVADVFQSTVSQFKTQQQDLDTQVSLGVASVNTYAGQIASLNGQISQVEATGMHANDLRDQRDLVVDHLSSMVKITTSESADGQMSINVGSHQLVDRGNVHAMQTSTTAAGGFNQVQWSAATTAATTGAAALPAALTANGTLIINGKNVAFVSGDAPATVVSDINNTVGLGPTGSVTASLDAHNNLVLTSNTPGVGGTVAIGAATGSASTQLGVSAGTFVGTDAVNVNLGGGKLQGLVDSRDTLLGERITDINALASRIIESVNSVHATGVGLDGKSGQNFFAGTDAASMSVDPALTAAGGTDKVAAGRMVADPTSGTGYSFAAGDSSNALALAGLQNALAQRDTTPGGLTPGQALTSSTVIGVDLSNAAANTTYTFTVSAGSPPTVSVNDGTKTSSAVLTVGADSTGKEVVNIDTGVGRLTLSAPANTTLSNALAGLNGQTLKTLAGPTTMGDQYAQQVSALGVESQTSKSQSANQQVLVNSLDTQRQQVSGVSLDEETINLMMYQKAYQAAARVISTMDGMLDTLINHLRMGT